MIEFTAMSQNVPSMPFISNSYSAPRFLMKRRRTWHKKENLPRNCAQTVVQTQKKMRSWWFKLDGESATRRALHCETNLATFIQQRRASCACDPLRLRERDWMTSWEGMVIDPTKTTDSGIRRTAPTLSIVFCELSLRRRALRIRVSQGK